MPRQPATPTRSARLVRAHPRGLVVAGWGSGAAGATIGRFAQAAGWPVLADPVSDCRTGPCAMSTYEAMLRVESFAAAHTPDIVVRVGAPLTSKVANQWLAPVPHVIVDRDPVWLDPDRTAIASFVADPDALLRATTAIVDVPERVRGSGSGSPRSDAVRAAIDAALDACAQPVEGTIARDVGGGAA